MSRTSLLVSSAVPLGILALALVPRPVGPTGADGAPTPIPGATASPEAPAIRLPIAFVENRGQADSPAAFLSVGSGIQAHFETSAITLDLASAEHHAAVRLHLEGASERTELRGEELRAATYNYLRGASERHRSGVPSYGSLVWSEVGEGLDLRVRDGGGLLEYDLLVEPGADLAAFAMRCEGHRSLRLEEDGTLVVGTELGELRQAAPKTWEVLADGSQRPLECRFRLLDADRWGFEAPSRDPELAMVVDPGLVWSSYFGGTLDEFGWRLHRYADGDLLFVGLTTSNDVFPAVLGTYQPAFAGGSSDNLIARFAADGSTLRWATYLGGDGGEGPFDLELDAAENLHLVGGTTSSNFPTTPGAYERVFNFSFQEAFYCALDASGQNLLYGTYLGGTGLDWCLDLELLPGGDVLLAGCCDSTDFPVTNGAFQTTYGGGATDAWLARLAPNGNGRGDLSWATYLGGNDEDGRFSNPFDLASMIELDVELGASGEVLVYGRTASTNFPTTAGTLQSTHTGNGFADLFLCALDANATTQLWGTFLGGNGEDNASDLHVLADGSFVLTGTSDSTDLLVSPGAWTAGNAGAEDAYVARVAPLGAAQTYGSYLGGSAKDDTIRSVIGSSNTLVLLLRSESSDFPVTAGTFDSSFAQGPFGEDIVVAKVRLDGNGANDLHYATYIGSFLQDIAIDAVFDGTSALPLTGLTMGQGYPTTAGTVSPGYVGGVFDAFVTVLDALPTGAVAYGSSVPACGGTIALGVRSQPHLSNPAFALTFDGAPVSAAGSLLVSTAPLASPLAVLGLEIWIDPAGVFFSLGFATDATGYARLDFPIPADPTLVGGQIYGQGLFQSPCSPFGLDASNGLHLTIQP